MKRRRFALASGSFLFTSSISTALHKPALGLDFRISAVPNKDPSEVDSILLNFSKFEMMPRYLDESGGIDLKIEVKIEGNVVESRSQSSIGFENGVVLDETDIEGSRIGEILVSPINSSETSIDGQVRILVDNRNLSEQEYIQDFSINPSEEITDSLVSRWTMDEGTGNTLTDTVGSYDGTLETPSWTSKSKQGSYALDFNRDDQDRVLLNNGNDLSDYSFRDTGLTVTHWVYPYQTGNSRHGLFSANDSNNWWNSRIESNGKYEFWYGSNGENPNTQTTSSPPTNKWSHFAATVDSNDHTVKVYYNGSFENSRSDGDTPNYKQFSNPTLGSRSGGNYADARIDDVRIYNRVLSEPEISKISNLNG